MVRSMQKKCTLRRQHEPHYRGLQMLAIMMPSPPAGEGLGEGVSEHTKQRLG
jgi:hypothetical protein